MVVSVGSGGDAAVLSPSSTSEVAAALLLAVVVELALPVHHVGGPAVELHLPLALRLVDVVWGRDRDHQSSLSSGH